MLGPLQVSVETILFYYSSLSSPHNDDFDGYGGYDVLMILVVSMMTITMMMVIIRPEAKKNCFADFDSGTERGRRGRQRRLRI